MTLRDFADGPELVVGSFKSLRYFRVLADSLRSINTILKTYDHPGKTYESYLRKRRKWN